MFESKQTLTSIEKNERGWVGGGGTCRSIILKLKKKVATINLQNFSFEIILLSF